MGRRGRSVAEVADALSCDWHTVNDAVIAYGEALMAADDDRIGTVRALSLDADGLATIAELDVASVDAGDPTALHVPE